MLRRLPLAACLFLAPLPAPALDEDWNGTLATPTGPLHGTLLHAGNHAPALLMIAGSGPTDRDGNSAAGVHADTYKLPAEGLRGRGISTLRTDKRGIGESRGAAPSEAALRFQAYADDARLWAADLHKRTGANCVWLLGHREGALAAGAGRKAGDLIRAQVAASPANPPAVGGQAGCPPGAACGRQSCS